MNMIQRYQKSYFWLKHRKNEKLSIKLEMSVKKKTERFSYK